MELFNGERIKQRGNDEARREILEHLGKEVGEMEGDQEFAEQLDHLIHSTRRFESDAHDLDHYPQRIARALSVIESELRKIRQTERGRLLEQFSELDKEAGKE